MIFKKAILAAMIISISCAASAQTEVKKMEEAKEFGPPPVESSKGVNIDIDQNKLLELIKKIDPVKLDDNAFLQVAQEQGIDLTPEMIIALRMLLAEKELALNQPVKEVKLNVAAERLTLSSIQPPISLNVKKGFDTFIEFYDLAGNPWPVEKFISVGAVEQFSAEALADIVKNSSKEGEAPNSISSNIVRVNAKSNLGDTTMTVQLRGVKETVNFRLVHNQLDSNADYKRVFTVPLINAEMANVMAGISPTGQTKVDLTRQRTNEFLKAANESYEPFFTGDVPDGAIEVPVLKGDATAWMYDGFLYVRSQIETITYPTGQYGVQSFSNFYVHKMVPYPHVSYYKNGQNVTIVLDDDALMTAVSQHKIMKEQKESADLSLNMVGG